MRREDKVEMGIKEKIIEQTKKWKAAKGKKKAAQLPVFKIGPNKKAVYVLWAVLIISVLFGVYKNFTAVDKETIYQEKVVEEKLKDSNAIESFIEKFAYTYHSWGNSLASHDERKDAICQYMTDELIKMNEGTINSDCPTASEVENFRIWSLEELGDGEYEVKYSVVQKFTEAGNLTGEEEMESETEEMEQEEEDTGHITVNESFYQVYVHVDEVGDMVIVRNPTVCGNFGKSSYNPAEQMSDGSVDNTTAEEVEEFLNTFFNLYPSATEKELTYYTKSGVMDVINADLVYAGLVNPVYKIEDGKIVTHVYVKYLDQVAKIIQLSEYTLVMEKGDNWKIVEVK